MKRVLLPLVLAQALGLAACAASSLDPPRRGVPPPRPVPGKVTLNTCTANTCDVIPVNVRSTGNACTAKFLFQGVAIESGVSATFLLYNGTPSVLFRFTDPSNKAGDPPGIDIDYQGQRPAFTVGYGAVTPPDKMRYDVTALRGYAAPGVFYPFKINTEASSDGGATWMRCQEIDPVIAND